MSALFAVAKSHSIEILSDAATTRSDNGVVVSFDPKQFAHAVPGVAISATGWAPPCSRFVELAHEHCADLDELVAACDALWAAARIDSPFFYGVLCAGWSSQRQALELWCITSSEPRCTERGTAVFYPTDEAIEAARAFMARFSDCRDHFDPEYDGIALMEELRQYRRQFIGEAHPIVGGWVEHTVVTQESIVSSIIHTWPEDRVGEVIRPAPAFVMPIDALLAELAAERILMESAE